MAMTDLEKLAHREQMLFETIHILEGMNLIELLPVDTLAWYGQRKIQEEADEERARTASDRLITDVD